jgi:uncharacterized protein (TIGR02145 family)
MMKRLTFQLSLLLILCSCEKRERQILIKTGTPIEVGSAAICMSGEIVDLGEGISLCGHFVSKSSSFSGTFFQSTIYNPGTGPYISMITGLEPNTLYYIKAYASNSNETLFGKTISYTTPSGFTDNRDGNIYQWIKIGNQIWMAENLAYLPHIGQYSFEPNKEPVYEVLDYQGTDVSEAKTTLYYNTYGVLYNLPALMAGEITSNTNPSGVQGVCPSGWHLPSETEWDQLITYQGGADIAGAKLKETGLTHWSSSNIGATNESGFTALPGGNKYNTYNFNQLVYSFWTYGGTGEWWSCSEYDTNKMYTIKIESNSNEVYPFYSNKDVEYCFSVRCVKD